MRWAWTMLLLAGLAAREARGCGLHWSKPVNHFDGVCEEGYVSHWEDWGTVDFGDGLKLPLIVGFRSDRNTDSPYLGRGWIVALLESHAYALDERKLRVVMPDGYHYTFRKKKNGVWDGNRGWLGEFKGNTFTAWAPCGWKIQWRDGKIQTIWTDKGRRIDYAYNGAMCTGVSESGRERVKVEQNPSTGAVEGLVLSKDAKSGAFDRIAVRLGNKPEVEIVAGHPLVGKMSRSLDAARWPGGREHQYHFETDEAGLPMLELTDAQDSRRTLTWRPDSRLIARDGHWLYDIIAADPPILTNSGICRTNLTTGRVEFWCRDRSRGLEIVEREGVRTTREWFTTGPAAGKIRSIINRENGKTELVRKVTFDRNGETRSVETGDGTKTFDYRGESRVPDSVSYVSIISPADNWRAKKTEADDIETIHITSNAKTALYSKESSGWKIRHTLTETEGQKAK